MDRGRRDAGAPPVRRVLSIATLYPNAAQPRFGTFVARSLEALAARGDWAVTVINPIALPPLALGRYKAAKAAAVDGSEHGVEVHRPTFRTIPKIGGRLNAPLISRAVLPLARKLHAGARFDLVDAQFFYPDGPAAARIAAELDLPLSIKARGSDVHYWGARGDTRSQLLSAGAQAAGLLAVSDALAADMAALGLPGERITVHPTGLDRDRFRPLQHNGLRRRLANELGIDLPERAPLLATVGTFNANKGQALVIEALAQLPPETRLLLVGRGESDSSLRALAKARGVAGRVHFLGTIDHDLLPLVLSAADAMVLPSAREGLANAWIEALACGTPLVITDAGGAREVVTAPEAGVIVARNPDAIARGVRLILDHPPVRGATAAMADRFGWQAHAAALAAYFEGLLA